MKNLVKTIIIAEDNWPLEQIVGRPIFNFIRRLLFGKYKVCRDCWYQSQACKAPSKNNLASLPITHDPH